MSKIAIPVMMDNLIQKVTDKKVHPEQRQNYAKTLKDIIDESQKAYNQWENEFNRK